MKKELWKELTLKLTRQSSHFHIYLFFIFNTIQGINESRCHQIESNLWHPWIRFKVLWQCLPHLRKKIVSFSFINWLFFSSTQRLIRRDFLKREPLCKDLKACQLYKLKDNVLSCFRKLASYLRKQYKHKFSDRHSFVSKYENVFPLSRLKLLPELYKSFRSF